MNIRELRISRCWSQEDLAKKSGLNIRTIQRIEAGKPASFKSLKSLSNIFDISIEQNSANTANHISHTNKPTRLYFLDNLRTFMIFLVVLYHSGGVYESSGLWGSFWLVDDPATNDMVGLVNLVIDIFVMSVIFFISGYFTPESINNKSNAEYIKIKFKRLMLPWILAVITLVPLYKAIYLYSRNLPQQDWTTYFHFSNDFISQSWMWFLPVLFIFNIGYLMFAKIKINYATISITKVTIVIFLIGVTYSYMMSYFDLRGWTKTMLIDFQNERILIYLMMFILGSICFRANVFDSDAHNSKLYNLVNFTSWVPITTYLFILIFSLIKPNDFIISLEVDQLIKWMSFHLSLLSIGYALIITFKRNFNNQTKLGIILRNNSYNVYIIHTIIIGGVSLLLLDMNLPSVVKFALLTISTYIISNIMAYGYQTILKPRFS